MRFRRGTDRNIGKFPKELEDKVVVSNDFDKVKKSIRVGMFELFSRDPKQREFDDRDLQEMRRGRAPYTGKTQTRGKGNIGEKTHLHHLEPRRNFKNQSIANRLFNIIAMSPLFHHEGGHTSDELHYGPYHGKRESEQKEKRATKYREQVKK